MAFMNLLSKKTKAFMNFIDPHPPRPFICLVVEINKKSWYPEKKIGETTYLMLDESVISDVQNEKALHSHHLRLEPFHSVNFFGRANEVKYPYHNNLNRCRACTSEKIGTTYYFCNECHSYYHKDCVESTPTFFSSYYPKIFQLLRYSEGVKHRCFYCGRLQYGLVYYSSFSDIFMDPPCARKQNFSTIYEPEKHEHILHFFPRKASIKCDVCASDDTKTCLYSCLQCDFIVHKRCIELPDVIQTSCHHCRLFFAICLNWEGDDWPCEVCGSKIDEDYASYSCKPCNYVVHTKCATSLEIEDQTVLGDADIKPLLEYVGDGIIRHFGHAHHRMILTEDIEKVFDAKKYCQACILPLYDGSFYTCMEMECDYLLHKECATLPRIKRTVEHYHRLSLEPVVIREAGYYYCHFCNRRFCGFAYVCSIGCSYFLDVRCASLSELVKHPSHPHPFALFINEDKKNQQCSTCERTLYVSLNCVEHDFVLCFRCATLPYKVKYEHDEHMLTLSYEKIASGPHWCHICEETTYPKKGYYACSECSVTFHTECLLGDDIYLKERQHILFLGNKFEIIPNNRLSRPICHACQKRCQYKIVFKTSSGNILCSSSEIFGI